MSVTVPTRRSLSPSARTLREAGFIGPVELAEHAGHPARRHRVVEEEALCRGASDRGQLPALLGGFHALGHDPQPKRPTELHRGLHDRLRLRRVEHVPDERPVDLHLIDRDPGQERERGVPGAEVVDGEDRKSTRLNSSHVRISYAVFCLKKKKKKQKNYIIKKKKKNKIR